MQLQRVGELLLGMHPPRPRASALALCSCGLAFIAPSDAAAEHALDRHQAEPAQVWIR